MTDTRELILSRLVEVCAGVSGIAAATRNRPDAPANGTIRPRPAVVIAGGAEQMTLAPAAGRRGYISQVQLMELSPQITILARADTGSEAGALLSLYRSRVVSAVLSDATLIGYVGTNGGIRYEGCAEPDPLPESQEPRIDVTLVFTYPLNISDLAA